MDETMFDRLSRTFAETNTRRDGIRKLAGAILGGALLGVPAVQEAAAHNALPACKRIKNKNRRTACIRRAKEHNKKHCRPGLTRCAGQCVNTGTSQAHCGACGNACAADKTCQNGVCVGPACNPGLTLCAGQCVNTQTSQANCGACGNACPAGDTCQNGGCVKPCNPPPPERSEGWLDPNRYIDVTATLHCDGRLIVDTSARNTHAFEGFGPRVRVLATDAAGNTWKSRLFEFYPTLCSTLDPSWGCKTERDYPAQEDLVPADFARRVVRLKIFPAHNVDPLP
jgi:hypothetical protein